MGGQTNGWAKWDERTGKKNDRENGGFEDKVETLSLWIHRISLRSRAMIRFANRYVYFNRHVLIARRKSLRIACGKTLTLNRPDKNLYEMHKTCFRNFSDLGDSCCFLR